MKEKSSEEIMNQMNASDLSYFYVENDLDSWLKVLGEKCHYHFGATNPNNPEEDIMDFSVRSLYKWISNYSKVLDCGCGWGGSARMFMQEKHCDVTGITSSPQHHDFIKNNIKGINWTLYNFMTSSLALVSHEIAQENFVPTILLAA